MESAAAGCIEKKVQMAVFAGVTDFWHVQPITMLQRPISTATRCPTGLSEPGAGWGNLPLPFLIARLARSDPKNSFSELCIMSLFYLNFKVFHHVLDYFIMFWIISSCFRVFHHILV